MKERKVRKTFQVQEQHVSDPAAIRGFSAQYGWLQGWAGWDVAGNRQEPHQEGLRC